MRQDAAQKADNAAQKAARERADLIRTVATLVERYHGDAGCPVEEDDRDCGCPACDAAALLARIEAAS